MTIAVAVKGKTIHVTGADTEVCSLNWARMQSATDNNPGPWRARVNAIIFIASASGTATTIKDGGSGGNIMYSLAPAAAGTTVLTFSSPQDFDDLTVTFGTNMTSVDILLAPV